MGARSAKRLATRRGFGRRGWEADSLARKHRRLRRPDSAQGLPRDFSSTRIRRSEPRGLPVRLPARQHAQNFHDVPAGTKAHFGRCRPAGAIRGGSHPEVAGRRRALFQRSAEQPRGRGPLPPALAFAGRDARASTAGLAEGHSNPSSRSTSSSGISSPRAASARASVSPPSASSSSGSSS